MNRLLTTLLTLSVLAQGAFGDELTADSAAVYFRQSKTLLDPGYKNNASSLSRLADELSDSASILKKHVRVIGSASPEGSVNFNEHLSRMRARRIFDYFTSLDLIAADSTEFVYTGRNWQGLKEMVQADRSVPDREEVMSLLESITRGDYPDDNEALQKLKLIGGGTPYIYMYHHLFPALRSSWIYVDFINPTPERIMIHSNVAAPLAATCIISEVPNLDIKPSFPHHKPFYMGLKTNMLYDLLAIPSIGAEFYLGKNISAVGNWYYSWWKNDHIHHYWRAYGGDVALRWWLGSAAHRKPLTGHHIGIYGGIITYDFELGGEGYMGGDPGRTLWDRFHTMAGVEYGYSLPVGRRLNIDFTIGIGYMGGRLQKYEPKDSHYLWKSTENIAWFGPTKAEISLVWLIGNGNYNTFNRRAQR